MPPAVYASAYPAYGLTRDPGSPPGVAVSPNTAEPREIGILRLLGHVEPSIERPYVVLKYAQTLDGRIATTNGDSQWIRGEAERQIFTCDASGL